MTAVNGNISNVQMFSSGFGDASNHAQVYQYLERLKREEFGWKNSADNIVSNNYSSIEEHFLLLQVIEDYLGHRYVNASSACIDSIRALLNNWLERLSRSPEQPTFLINKMAHIFSLVFAIDFPDRWPQFMNDMFLSREFTSISLVIFYLKTLLAIDAEVVDKDIQRSKQMFERNTKVKDFMREICINQMVESWWKILENISDVTAQCLCLDVVAAFVDWIDVELVANEKFVQLVLERLANKDTSESAVNAVSALMQKGMAPSKKYTLLMALAQVFRNNQLITVSPNSDSEDVERAGSLLNTLGTVLLDCYSKFKADSFNDEALQCLDALEVDIDSYLLVLDNENPELSELVIDTIRSYCLIVRDHQHEIRINVLSRVVSVCLRRFAMNEELDIDGEGEDELEFHEYRKELRSILQTIGNKRPELVVAPLESMVNDVVGGSTAMPIGRLEAVVQLVYSLSEIIPSNFVQTKDGWLGRAALLPTSLLSGIVLDGRSATVHVLFFETACRYERLLSSRPEPAVKIVAAAFLDERGIAIPISKVRTRIVYLFCRFVKAHKAVLSPLVSEVITRLEPLLAVSPQSEQFLSADDQAFIYEATATLIVFGELSIEQKTEYLRGLANNLASKFQSAVSELEISRTQGNEDAVKLISSFMCNIVGFCSRMSKAFNTVNTMRSCQCVEIYLNFLNMFLEQLSTANLFLLESIRQLAHRLVVCLDEEFLPILPELMSKLESVSNDLDSMNHLLILSHQVIAKHKKNALTSGVDFGLILTTAARFSLVQTDTSRTRAEDESIERNMLYVQRAYLQLMFTIASGDMLPFLAQGTDMNNLLEAASKLALSKDHSSQKLALSVLTKVSAIDSSWWRRTVRTALEVPALDHINPSDAGSTLVVHEVSSSLNALKTMHPEDFQNEIQALLPAQMAADLLLSLETCKSKELDKNIMTIYASVKAPTRKLGNNESTRASQLLPSPSFDCYSQLN